jgi:methyl-accepting chemotaxis protein
VLIFAIITGSVFITAFIITTINANALINEFHNNAQTRMQDIYEKYNLQLSNMESTIKTLAVLDEFKQLDVDKIEKMMREVTAISPYLFIYVTDLKGQQLNKSYGDLIDISDREYFIKAVNGEANFSNVLVSRTQLHPVVIYAQPLLENGAVVGIIAGAIDVSYLADLTKQTSDTENQKAYIVDSKGVIVIHPNKNFVNQRKDFSDLSYVQAALRGESNTKEFFENGKRYLISYRPLEKINGGIIVETNVSRAYEAIKKLMSASGIIIFLVTLVAGLISYFIARSFTNILTLLNSQVYEAIGGNEVHFSEKQLTGKDELSGLSIAIKKLIESKWNGYSD